MIGKLSFRNVLRNKRRTIITCLIMGCGLAALIFADAFLHGLTKNLVESVTNSFLGDGQIHHKDFLKGREIEKTIENSTEILSSLKKDSRIKIALPRVISSGLISSPTDMLPINVFGILPDEEILISSIKSNIQHGEYLDNTNQDKILIGEKLAKFLGVGVGDKIVVTMAQAHTGALSQELLRVGGTFKMKNKDLDSSVVFIHMNKLQKMLSIDEAFHEIVFKFKSPLDTINPPPVLLNKFSQNNNEALSWKKLVPAIDAGIQLTSYSLYIGTIILFAIIALSTMNTLFMSLHERMYEFGIMKSIGTRPLFIFRLIIMEAFFLALISSVLGIALGFLITLLTHFSGISHFTDVEYLGTTIKSSIYPVFLVHQYYIYPIAIIIFATLSAIYPAISAARIIPSQTMKKD